MDFLYNNFNQRKPFRFTLRNKKDMVFWGHTNPTIINKKEKKMATLHMDIEAVQGTLSKMRSEREAMLGELNTLTSQVGQTVGSSWIGNSATEFQQNYEQLRNQITQQMDALEQLAQNLQTEIAQWQETAARLGG